MNSFILQVSLIFIFIFKLVNNLYLFKGNIEYLLYANNIASLYQYYLPYIPKCLELFTQHY